MSGICGVIDFGAGFTGGKLAALMAQMQNTMIHRGFERDSLWMGEQTQVALSDCHLLTSRTAIIANSAAQIQIVYDGDALASTRGAEVKANQYPPVLAELARVFADSIKSPIHALRAIETPFALALWNDRLKKLLLARDAFDSKPLYFSWGRGWFAFASELRALKLIPGFNPALDQNAVHEYLANGFVAAPRCMYQGARKVTAGGFVELDCAPLLASANLISIHENAPAASGVITMLAPLCGEPHSSNFHAPEDDPQLPYTTPVETQPTLAEQSELLRRALLDSLQQSRFRSSSVHILRAHEPTDALLSAMCRLELQLETHTYSVTDPLHAPNTPFVNDLDQHIGAIHHQGESLEDFSEILNRVINALDEPIGLLDSLCWNANAAFTRANTSHALCGVSVHSATRVAELTATRTSFLNALLQRKNPIVAPDAQTWPCQMGLMNQLCAHHSLAVGAPFLNHHVAAGLRGASNEVLVHILRGYLPEKFIARLTQTHHSTITARAELALAQLSESILFTPQSMITQFTNRIALRGLLASPSATPRDSAQRQWLLLILESWLRRHVG